MNGNGNGWRAYARNELRDFDDRAKEIIMSAQELGALCRLSSKGHMIVRAKNGMTISVSRNLKRGNRASKNAAAQFKRTFGSEEPAPAEKQKKDEQVDYDNEKVIVCPAKGCGHTFSGPHAEKARDHHIDSEHYRCTEPGCDHVVAKRQGIGGHIGVAHRGNQPWKLAQEALKGKPRPPRKQAEPEPVKLTPVEPMEPRASGAVVESVDIPPTHRDAHVVKQIRDLLGADPRVAELEKENEELRAKIDELEARLALVKEAFGA